MHPDSAPTSRTSTAPTRPQPTAIPRTEYRQVGASGLYLPPISLGLWWNFGDNIPFDRQRELLRHAFDKGITHFDLANNYGPPYGSAETNFGRMMREDFAPLPRRADHLVEGRVRHVAGTLRRPRLAQVHPGERRAVADAG